MNFYLLLAFAMVIWGISWAMAKQISPMASVEVIMFWRNLTTFLALIPAIFFLKEKPNWKLPALRQGLYGAIIMTAYNYLFFFGLKYGLAGAGGVLVTTLNPIINFGLVAVIYGNKIGTKEKFGLSLGLLAGFVLLHIWNITPEELGKGGNIAFLIASLFWALLSIQTQRSSKHIAPISYSFLVYGISTLLTFALVSNTDWTMPLRYGWNFWGNLLYLSVISTAFATTVYFYASSNLGSHRASAFIFIVPGSAVLGSWLILGETPAWNTIVGGVLALIAARVLHVKPQPKEEETELVR